MGLSSKLVEGYKKYKAVTVQILCFGTDRSQKTVQTKISASEEAVWSGSTLFAIPSASFGCINAMLHQTFLFLGQLWQLFEVSQILEFLRYLKVICRFRDSEEEPAMFQNDL